MTFDEDRTIYIRFIECQRERRDRRAKRLKA